MTDRRPAEPGRLPPLPPDPLPAPQGVRLRQLPPTPIEAEIVQTSKPLSESRTARSGLVILLAALWAPIMALLGAACAALGIPLDPTGWVSYLDDSTLSGGEIIAMVRDVVIAVAAMLVIKFRAGASATIQGWFKKH